MLAKIGDAGAKANCYLSCFNDLLGLRSLNKNLNASWTNNLIQTNLANNNAKANDRAIIPVFASKVQASIIRIDLHSPDSSGKKYKPTNIRNIIFRHILKIKIFVDCFSLTLNFKSNPNACRMCRVVAKQRFYRSHCCTCYMLTRWMAETTCAPTPIILLW